MGLVGIICAGAAALAAAAMVGWHMVRPTFQDLRVSVARFLPELTPSSARRNRISLTAPLRSWPFALRLLAFALIGLGLWDGLPRFAPAPEAPGGAVRLVVDLSPSMAVGERTAEARALVTAALDEMDESEICVELFVAGEATPRASGPAPAIAPQIAALTPGPDGQPSAALLATLARPATCAAAPGRALIVTDAPQMPVPEDRFAGTVLWAQVGAPEANAALLGLDVLGGGLTGAEARAVIRARSYGPAPERLQVQVDGTLIDLRPDPARSGDWLAQAEIGARMEIALVEGGALGIDDRITAELGGVIAPAVQWGISELPRPLGLSAAEAGVPALAVMAWSGGPVLGDGAALAVFDGRAVPGLEIGAFAQDHPVLEGLNFDVLERVGLPTITSLPDGFVPILSAANDAGVWVAVRAEPRGVILPSPSLGGDEDRSAMSLTLFYNALQWVSGFDQPRHGEIRHMLGDRQILGALFESDTARPAASGVPDLARLLSPAPMLEQSDADQPPPADWLALGALALLLAERLIGLVWRQAA